jgi:2-(1,2-epoxy-1,2-dihydrophenyl)acetyl-CoA isomerase
MSREESTQAAEDLVRRAYAAFAARDLERLRELSVPEIEISTVTGLIAGRDEPYRGHEGIERYLDDVRAMWDEIELIPQQFHQLDRGRLLVFGRVRARRGGTLIDAPNAWLWTLREGRIAAAQVFADPQEATQLRGRG